MINFILFQIQWFLCVLNINYGFLYALGILFAQILFLLYEENILKLFIVLALGLIGIIFDTLLMHAGVFVFPKETHSFIVPNWLIVLWFCFSMWYIKADYINQKLLSYTILCMIFGPFSYYIGVKFGALIFGMPMTKSLMLIGFNWLILGIVFITINKLASNRKLTRD